MSTSIPRIITLCMFISLVASTPTFNFPIINIAHNVPTGTARSAQNGIIVSLPGPGWVVSDVISNSDTTFFTPVILSGNLGVGLAIANDGGSSCTGTRTLNSYLANPIGTAATATQCPADFLTSYNALPTGTSMTNNALQGTNPSLALGNSYRWVLDPGTNAACLGLTVSDAPTTSFNPADSTTYTSTTVSTAGTCSTTDSSGVARNNYVFAYYVETIQTTTNTNPEASVCFQTQAQFTANPGVCGNILSAGILSAVGSIIATVALFFLN